MRVHLVLAVVVGMLVPTVVAEARPKKRATGRALVLVIDRSGSMQGAKLQAATDAALAVVAALGPEDQVAMIAFDSEAQTFVRLQRAANRARIGAEIVRLRAGGSTDLVPGIREAVAILRGATVKTRHMIVLTDGETPTDGLDVLLKDARKARISISTVGLPGADQDLLDRLGADGGGRSYRVDDVGDLPTVFVDETELALK